MTPVDVQPLEVLRRVVDGVELGTPRVRDARRLQMRKKTQARRVRANSDPVEVRRAKVEAQMLRRAAECQRRVQVYARKLEHETRKADQALRDVGRMAMQRFVYGAPGAAAEPREGV